MPESMFGRPSQHLLPSKPKPAAGGSSGMNPQTAPVQPAPPPFKDFRFNSIGKQPNLLSRISLPQPDSAHYHSPTPSPMSTPPPNITNGPQSSSRRTLLEQLATSQSNGSLASRIQMSGSPSNDMPSAHSAASTFPIPPLRVITIGRTTEDANLIPPVEVLPQLPDSSPPTPVSWAPTLEPADVYSPAYSTPLANTMTVTTSQIPAVTMDTASRGTSEALPSLPVVDGVMRHSQPSSSTTTAIDSLMVRQQRLQSISAKFASLASPTPLPPSQSPAPDTPSITRASSDINPNQSSQSQHSSAPIVLRNPYPTDQSSSQVGLSINHAQTNANNTLALVPSPTTLTQEFQTQGRAIFTAVQSLNSALSAAHRAQTDTQNALEHRVQMLEEDRAAFEQTRRTEENKWQKEFQELQRKREELDAKAAMLVSSEKEVKAREEARKCVLAKRQAQEEQRRAAEAKRMQELMAAAMNELKEIEELKAKCSVEQLAIETVQDDLPTEPQEGMDEREREAIKSRNELLRSVEHLRRMHSDRVQKLEETTRTLRRLGVERESRKAEEAERQVAEEERLRVHAEMERARQLPDEKRRSETEGKRQEVEKDREQAQLLLEQQAHAEVQAHSFGLAETTNGHISRHPSRLETTGAQGVPDTSRIYAASEIYSPPRRTTDAIDVDENGNAPPFYHTVPSPDTRTSPGTSQLKDKKDKPTSGGVVLAASNSKGSGVHLHPKPRITPSSLVPSDHVTKNTPKLPSTSLAVSMSVESGHKPLLPTQPASGFNRGPNGDVRLTPDCKPAFSRTPKSQTILDVANGGSQELSIGPVASVSPTQQTVNLRHLKRVRGCTEGDSGDRSVRTIQVKGEENTNVSLKEENDEARERAQASLSDNLPASLPPRPAIIPPPRPRMPKKRPELPAPQTDPSGSSPLEREPLLSKRTEIVVATDGQSPEALPGDTSISQAMNAAVKLPVHFEATNSLLLGAVRAEPQDSGPRINADERPTRDRGENSDSTPSEPSSAAPSHDLDGENPPRSKRRFTDEQRRARNAKGSRRVSDHYSAPSTSPTQAHYPNNYRVPRPENSSIARAEPMHATSPTAGRKRSYELNDSDYGRRIRRRDDVWVGEDRKRDWDWGDSYRSYRDKRPDPDLDERHTTYRRPASPLDRARPYPSDAARPFYDSRLHPPEEPLPLAARWEQSYRRIENDGTYQRYPLSAAYNAAADYHPDDARVGQTYESMTEERTDTQADPALLTRMRNTQYFPPRGRGRGETSRGRGEHGRGRGRGVARGGTPLIERLTAGPSSLGERLTRS